MSCLDFHKNEHFSAEYVYDRQTDKEGYRDREAEKRKDAVNIRQ